MAYEGLGVRLPGILSGTVALSANQFHFVQIDDTINPGTAILALTAGQKGVVGVLQDKPAASGDPCLIVGGGVTKVVTGSAVTAGKPLYSDSTGRAITASVSASYYIVGRALEAAAAAGTIISMVFQHEGPSSNDL